MSKDKLGKRGYIEKLAVMFMERLCSTNPMRRKRSSGQPVMSMVLLLAASGLLPGRAAATPPLAAFGQLPAIEAITISGDGTKYAAIVGTEDSAEIQIRNLADNKLIMKALADKAKLRDLSFVGANHLVATSSETAEIPGLSGGRREWFTAQEFNLKTGVWTPLLRGLENALNVQVDQSIGLIIDGEPVAIVPGISFPGGTRLINQVLPGQFGVLTLYRINLETGQVRTAAVGNRETVDWIVDGNGEAVARADYDQSKGNWRLLVRSGGKWLRSYSETAPVDRPALLTLSRTADRILVETRQSGDYEVHEVVLADGSWSPPQSDYDSTNLMVDPLRRTLVGTIHEYLDHRDYRFFNDADAQLWSGIVKSFPGELVSLAGWSDDRNIIVVEVVGPTNGDGYYIINRRAKTANWLADRYRGIAPQDVGFVQTIRYKAADGLEIPAYITLPPGVTQPKGLPLVVLAHGGPEWRDNPGFDWWAQAIASRGYVVLQPQFRGSSGFGMAHRDAGFGQWGRKMQTDLSDGVRHLAAQGMIDPTRVCIVGASYGGYAALAGATIDTGVYRCAASVSGVSDLRRMLLAEIKDSGNRRNATLRYWKRFMGASSAGDAALDDISPLRLADKAKVPVLLVHGKDDTVVPYDQSTTMESALRKAGATVELVTLEGEDHWLSRPVTRTRMLTATMAFVEQHNPVTRAAPAVAP